VAEDERAERAHAETRPERREARQKLCCRVGLRKEKVAEKDGEAAVEIKVVPLKQGAERSGQDHLAERPRFDALDRSHGVMFGEHNPLSPCRPTAAREAYAGKWPSAVLLPDNVGQQCSFPAGSVRLVWAIFSVLFIEARLRGPSSWSRIVGALTVSIWQAVS